MTDYNQQVLDLANENIEHNHLSGKVTTKYLKWGDETGEKYDFILGSEVTYSSNEWVPLAQNICSSSKSKTIIIL